MTINKQAIMGIGLAALVLSACSQDTRENLGLVKSAPDEFAVVTRAPLSVPPDYNLRPPMPGQQRPMEISTVDMARQTVFGEGDVNRAQAGGTAPSEGFLDRIGAAQANPDIRTVVDQESQVATEDKRPVAERLLFWRDGDEPAGEPLDPMEERRRLESEGGVTIEKRNEETVAP